MGRCLVAALLLLYGCSVEPARRPPAPDPRTATPAVAAATDGHAPLARAVALVRAGDDTHARPLLTDLRAADPVLADYYLHFLALVNQRDGREAAAAALDDQLAAEQPGSVWIPHVLARQAVRAAPRDPRAAAAQVARALAHPDADAESRALALLVRGRLRVDTDPREACQVFLEVRRLGGWPAKRAREHTTALETAHPSLLADVELQLAEAGQRAAEGRRDLAVARLEALASVAPEHERGRVLLALAHTLRLAEHYDEAVAVLERAVARDPSPANPARLQLAFRLWSQDHDAAAQAVFERILRDTPDHPSRVTMRYALARVAEERGDLTTALGGYRRIAESADPTLAGDARWRLGWAPYRAGDLEAAAAGFRAVEHGGGTDRTAAVYWQARAHARRGESAAAVALYERVAADSPTGYYGGLAEARLGRAPVRMPPPAALPALPTAAETAGDAHWRRHSALLRAGLEPLAAREVAAWARRQPLSAASERATLAAYASVGLHARARTLAHRLAERGTITNPVRLRYDYPKAYWRDVERLADELALDPFLVLSIMRQESLFDAEAISPVGARGLMQLMPNTARRLAGAPVDLRALADPATNIALGARYLRQLLDRYDDRVTWAVAAYNAGEQAVDKWIARTGDVEADEFVESISYRETRTYAKAVLANLRRYRQLYAPS